MMSTSERSIYMDLLYCVYEYNGSIPSDPQKLAVLAAVSLDELNRAWATVGRNFVPCQDDPTMLTNLVALETMQRQASIHAAKSEAGRVGGLASGVSRKQKRSGASSTGEAYREENNQTREEEKEEEHKRAPLSGALVSVRSSLKQKNPFREVTPTAEQEKWFADFWVLYWVKKSKKRALEVFATKVQSQATFDRVIEALKEQSAEMLRARASSSHFCGTLA